ncbi:carbohydrate kinase family protein [Nostocoides veronense]|uniref:Carbohydrate kinase PfkB domain-containing protein n=1 Tax=Nostocoides veronense TaxID=330836 RepID=A0ABN2LV16_9MICO
MRVLVAGHLCLDFIPALDDDPGHDPGALYLIGPMQVRLGGAVHTTGAALAALGIDILLAAASGNDSLAGVQRELLARKGLDASRMVEVEGATSYSIVLQPPGQDRTFWHHTGCNDLFDGTALELEGVDLVHIGYPNLLPALGAEDGMPLRRLFEAAHARGVVTSVDLAVEPTAAPEDRAAHAARWQRFLEVTTSATDLLTPSIDDLESAVHWGLGHGREALAEAARRLIGLGAAVVMVTGGEAGLHVATTADAQRLAELNPLAHLDPGLALHIDPVVPERIAGTTGAGDTATAAFLATLLDGGSLRAAGERAAYLASRHIAGLPVA